MTLDDIAIERAQERERDRLAKRLLSQQIIDALKDLSSKDKLTRQLAREYLAGEAVLDLQAMGFTHLHLLDEFLNNPPKPGTLKIGNARMVPA